MGREGGTRALALCAALALGACAVELPRPTLLRRAVLDPPAAYPDFPYQAGRAGVWAEATFYEDHEELFGVDLLRQGLLPVSLRVGSTRSAPADLHLAERSLDARLYLQDGTALAWERSVRIAGTRDALADRLSELSLELTRLAPWEQAQEGFLFFRFDPDEVRVQASSALSRRPGVDRELDLLRSVLMFTVSSPEGPIELGLGLKGDRWGVR